MACMRTTRIARSWSGSSPPPSTRCAAGAEDSPSGSEVVEFLPSLHGKHSDAQMPYTAVALSRIWRRGLGSASTSLLPTQSAQPWNSVTSKHNSSQRIPSSSHHVRHGDIPAECVRNKGEDQGSRDGVERAEIGEIVRQRLGKKAAKSR